MKSHRTRIARLRAIASLAHTIGAPANEADAVRRLCEEIAALAGGAAALFAISPNGGVATRTGASGFALLPPDELPRRFDSAELERLGSWAIGAGFARLQLAPFADGLLAVFGARDTQPLDAGDLHRLGRAVEAVLAHTRSVDERRALHDRRRIQDQLVRTERLRALGDMALGVAHDFNNVLNAILGQVGVLEMLADGRADITATVGRLKRAALDGADTVGRLQDFTRRRRDREFGEVDLAGLVGDAAECTRARNLPGIVVNARLESAVTVAGNAGELSDALSAVVANACEAMPGGGRLNIDLLARDSGALLTVSDSGAGMTREARKRAFDPFFTTKGSRVAGLGLSVAYGIVRRHGGSIEIESTVGQGTTVKVKLPTLTRPALSAPQPAACAAGGAPLRLLLIEDDDDNRAAMAELLRLAGHEVVAAPTGIEGVSHIAGQSGTFDLVLTDLGLPDMTGWDVARAVKESSSTPVALITGWGLNLAADAIRERGVDLLIKKPLEPQRFLADLALLARPGRYQAGPQ